MSTSRIAPPSLAETLERLDAIAGRHPERLTRHRYVTVAADGAPAPYDMIATLLQQLGLDLSVFTQDYDSHGPLTHAYTRGKFNDNNVRGFQVLWDTIFDVPDTLFLTKSQPRGRAVAEQYIVYALLTNVQKQQDAGFPWAEALKRAKRRTRTFLNDKYSGFLVQTNGQHADLLAEATAALK